jgi:hypothetical protein
MRGGVLAVAIPVPIFQTLAVSSLPSPGPIEEPPSYELEPEKHGWRKVLAWLRTGRGILLVFVLVLVIVAAWNARALYRVAKVWRAERLIARCEEAARNGDDAAQTRYLRQAFALLPSDPLTWRALAHYHERRGEGAALLAYEHLLETEQATLDDAIRACRQAAMRGSPDSARRILERVEKMVGARDLTAVVILRARLLATGKSWDDALALAQEAVERGGGEAPEKLIFATLLLQAADRAAVAQRMALAGRAVTLFAELAKGPDDSAVEALSTLLALARQPAAASLLEGYDIAAWIDAAERHPKATPRLRLLAWSLQAARNAADADKFFAGFVEKWRNSPVPQRLEAARWLNQNGRPRLSLELSTPQKDLSEDWFLAHLDALAATGQWEVVLENLDAKTGQAAAMAGALRALFRFRARSELRQPIDVEETWRDIQIQLQGEPVSTQVYVGQYAEKTGALKQAAAIYRRVLDEAAAPASFDRAVPREAKLVCYTGLIRSIPPNAPVADVLPLMEALVADFPELDEARNDAIYLRLLSGSVKDSMRPEIAKLLERFASMLAYRSTAALLELRAGNAAAADKLYEGWKIDWDTAADRFKAVRAAVLAAAGRADEAKAMREEIRETNLRPEELALLAPR